MADESGPAGGAGPIGAGGPKGRGAAALALHALASGRVQGVGFRWTCRALARRLGLSGWVRNCPGGDVEVWAEGSEAALEEFAGWLRHGPPGARVQALDCERRPALGLYQDFDADP